MQYEVRYMVNNEELSQTVDVETAAEAADLVKSQHSDPEQTFELIQVQLLEDPSDTTSGVVTEA